MNKVLCCLMTSTALVGISPACAQNAASGAESPSTDPSAQAQSANAPEEVGLGEIVVTARQRAENLQRVPNAIAALGEAAIEKKNIKEINFRDRISIFTTKRKPAHSRHGEKHKNQHR